VRFEEDGLHLGSMTRLDDVVKNRRIREEFSLLAEAAGTVATPQIRNVATVGGNICQEPRCWYYRYRDNYFKCLRKGGNACNALVGNNMYHSIFGAAYVGKTACSAGCPNGTNIPAYMERIRSGAIPEAADILFGVNPLPMVTGRVCPHNCQHDCARSEYDDAVGIRNVERYLGDYIMDNRKDYYKKPRKENGKRVAVIGAGPAGLTAAYYLRTNGFAVTVYDENSHIGGMLYYGIPSYRLPNDILDRMMQIFAETGIRFEMNRRIGRDIELAAIRNDADAVIICNGAWLSQSMGIPGDDAGGVTGGIDFLNMVSKEKCADIGRRVIVVGGGNTAMDACRTAKRLGADSVINLYRRTRNEMPADDIEIDMAAAEGVEFKFLHAPLEIIKDDQGKVSRLKIQRMEPGAKEADGRRKPVPVHGATTGLPADTVIVAIGQTVDLRGFEMIGHSADKMDRTDKANRANKTDKTDSANNPFAADEHTYMSNVDGIFCAGDSLRGPGTAVEAISTARHAASSVSEYLGEGRIRYENEAGAKDQQSAPASAPEYRDVPRNENCLNTKAAATGLKPAADRNLREEDAPPFPPDAAATESRRCFNCGCVAVNASDLAPALVALNAKLVTSTRTIDAPRFFAAAINSTTILDGAEYLKEIIIPPQGRKIQLYEKYRIRKSIDFPIVSVAAVLDIAGGTLHSAKLALGAAGPVPHELHDVEALMAGRPLDERLIDEAGELAVASATPLAENAYKIQLTKATIKKVLRKAMVGEVSP
jgi:NADPH-dependent glutamate synthase beta subunit-like oxidoreductase